MSNEQPFITKAYEAFNARDINTALALMDPDVIWPNGMEGGTVHGREAVRDYWTRQWTLINPTVQPMNYQKLDDGRIDVTVHQVVKDTTGNLIQDRTIHHIYAFKNGLISDMEIKDTQQ